MRVSGSTWVVTGGGNGLGRELVLELLARGARVAAVDIRGDDLGQTAALAGAGERMSTHVVDITDRNAVESLPAEVMQSHGPVDGLINNAGIMQPFAEIKATGYDTIHRLLDVNLMGTIHMVKSFLPGLLERPQAHVVNVSSMGGFFPFPWQGVYGASKAAVKLLSEGLYAELLDTPVAVSVAFPGALNTGIAQNSGAALAIDPASSRMPTLAPDRAARILLDGVEKDKLHIFVGRDARLMDLAVRIAPGLAIRLASTRMKALLGPRIKDAAASGGAGP